MNPTKEAWNWIEEDRRRQMARMEEIRREQAQKKLQMGRLPM